MVEEGRQTPAHAADPVFVSNGSVAALPAWHGPAGQSDSRSGAETEDCLLCKNISACNAFDKPADYSYLQLYDSEKSDSSVLLV